MTEEPTRMNFEDFDPDDVPDGEPFFTVRLGDKWQSSLYIGEDVRIGDTGHTAEVTDIIVTRLENLKTGDYPMVLEFEQNPDCTTYEGLYEKLYKYYICFRARYEDENEKEIITCIGMILQR